MDKLNIHNEMAQLDLKQRDFYDTLTDEERRKFSNYLMIRWSSTVQGISDLQEFYVVAVNEQLNKHFFSVNRHPKLQWLMATAVSPGLGRQKHTWIAPKKKNINNKKAADITRRLAALYPTMKQRDIDVWASVITPQELADYERDLGL